MKHLKKNIYLIILLTLTFALSACGPSLQKPTGLEDVGQEQLDDQKEMVEQSEDVEQLAKNDIDELGNLNDETEIKESLPRDSEQPKEESISKKPNPEKTTTVPAEKQPAKVEESTEKTTTSTEKPIAKPVEKPAQKPVEQPVAKPDPQPTKPVEKPTTSSGSKIVFSIVISSSEVSLPPTEMEIKDGDSVLSALIAITKKHKVQMDYRGGQGASAYIEGIDNVYEFDRGQGSGWMYRVNGVFPDRGAGAIQLQDGDRVEWLYTTNLGDDLNAELKPFRR